MSEQQLGSRGARLQNGRLAAQVLERSWRVRAPALSITASDLRRATPVLLHTMAGGLGWSKVLAAGGVEVWPGTAALRDAYIGNAVFRSRREVELQALCAALHEAGVDAALIKGWDMARRYPTRGLRGVGDIDICVRPPDREMAKIIANELGIGSLDVRHVLMARMAGGEAGVLHRRDHAPLDATTIPVPSSEDALRLACLHVVQHGASWPHMLCDVSLLVETAGPFDWELVLGTEPVSAGWVMSVLRLTRDLLGADISATPAANMSPYRPPVLDAIMRRWGSAPGPRGHDRTTRPLRGWQSGWTDPISAAFRLGRPVEARWPTGLTLRHYLIQHREGAKARLRARRANTGGPE